ncbi:hypothetical protein DH2020_017056 [Rehmannia glutinosa]|uniref:R2R3-MYB protein n=1 Tax=Rehmannia glutinosa TaxID=99300 RepID=A0ABR0WRF2_REHGL
MGRGRAPCCDKSKVRTGPWSTAEDLRLINFIQKHGHPNWRALPKQAGLLRCGKSCRLRWINYLRPDLKRGNFTPQEEETIIQLHNTIGNKWSKIAASLPGRTDNEIKNVWNTHLKKRLITDEANKHSTMDDHSPNTCSSNYCTSSSSTSISTSGDDNLEILHCDPDNSPKQASGYSDNGYIENIPSDINIDIGVWELLNSNINPLQESNKTDQQINSCGEQDTNLSVFTENNVDGEIELSKWLRLLENELGLTNDDGDHLRMDGQHTVDQQITNFEPEISPAFLDYSPIIWPSSPQYLGD